MVRWLCYLVGVDFAQIKSGNNILLAFAGLIIFVLSLASFGFYYAIYNTTESLVLGIIVAIFFTLLILNVYRLVFSISEGELTKYDKFSEINVKKYALERDRKLIEIQKKVDLENSVIQQKINASNFFITKIKLLFTHIPESWLLTLMIISIFLSPFYVFLLTPLFTEYDTACANASRQIIIDEYNSFKELSLIHISEPTRPY